MEKRLVISLSSAALLGAGCISATDKNYVDNLDCNSMAKYTQVMPTSSASVLRDWERDERRRSERLNTASDGLFDITSSDKVSSEIRRQYARRC